MINRIVNSFWLEKSSAITLTSMGLAMTNTTFSSYFNVPSYLWIVAFILVSEVQVAALYANRVMLRCCASWLSIIVATCFAFATLNIPSALVATFICLLNVGGYLILSHRISLDWITKD